MCKLRNLHESTRGRIRSVVFPANGSQRLHLGQVGNEGGDFYHVIESGAACGERGLQILEDLRHLSREIAFADDVPGFIERNLSGDIQRPSAMNLNDVRVAGWSGKSRRIYIPDINC